MDSVISITREKTAIIFPNAIGLQTKNDKVCILKLIIFKANMKILKGLQVIFMVFVEKLWFCVKLMYLQSELFHVQ